MLNKSVSVISVFALAAAMLAGCGGGSGSMDKQPATAAPQVKQDPVTITLGIRASYLTDTEIKRYFTDPVQKKYPHMTIEVVRIDDKTNSFQNLLATGGLPDVNFIDSLTLQSTKLLGMQQDLTEIIKKHNYDLTRLNADLLDIVKTNNQTDFLVGFPYVVQFNALYYNKDIFDKFGVAYPKDGMTWAETIDIAKKLTRSEGGIQYRGLEPDSVFRPGSQLSLPLIDPKTYKSIADTDSWRNVLQLWKDIYSIPGNNKVQAFASGVNSFIKEQNIAMLAGLNNLGRLEEIKDKWTNWDMASYPVFPEKPGIGTQADMHVMLLSPSSKNKDAAFQVMTTVLSDEVQLDMAHMGKGSVLKDKKFQDEFGKNLDFMKGKNIQAAFKTKPAKAYPPTEFAGYAFSEITALMGNIVKNNMDVNTAIRQYDEKVNKYIEQNRK